MNAAVDSDARRRLAELVRHLAAGRITNDDFEDLRPTSKERGLRQIYLYGLWPLYDDLFPHRLVGKYALTPEAREVVARITLFLRTDIPYRYPHPSPLLALPVMIGSLLTLGWFGRYWLYRTWRDGDRSVWPFYSREEYEEALRNPVYLAGRADP